MKITLDASIKEHRDIIKLFFGQRCILEGNFTNNENTATIIGFTNFNEVACDHNAYGTLYDRRITIDLDQAQMDLRMAIGTNIKFRAIDRYGHIINGQVIRVSNDPITSVASEIISVMESTKIYKNFNNSGESEIKLCPDYLKSVGVEVEE